MFYFGAESRYAVGGGLRYGVFTPPEMSEGTMAQAAVLRSKVDAVANGLHKRSPSLLRWGRTATETPRTRGFVRPPPRLLRQP